MRVVRTACRRCQNDVRKDVFEPWDTRSYSEKIEYSLCSKCASNPQIAAEDKLIQAIFGEGAAPVSKCLVCSELTHCHDGLVRAEVEIAEPSRMPVRCSKT